MIDEEWVRVQVRQLEAQLNTPVEYDAGNAFMEPSPELVAASAAAHTAKTVSARRRARKYLDALMHGRKSSEVDKVALAIGMATSIRDLPTRIVTLTLAAQRARRAGALRAALHALKEAQTIHLDADRQRLMDEITSDLVTGRRDAAPPPETASASNPGRRPATKLSASPPKSRTKSGGPSGWKAKNTNACAGREATTRTADQLSRAPSTPNGRPLVVARAMDRLTAADLARLPADPSMAFVTVLSAATDGFLGTVEIAHSNRGERTWRCPRCGSGVGELHLTGSRRLECASCRDHVSANWHSFGPDVTALIERMVRGEYVPSARLIEAVAHHTEGTA